MRKNTLYILSLLVSFCFINGLANDVVIIDGCVFQSGANVKIEAGSVEIVKSFTAERGSRVVFKHYVD